MPRTQSGTEELIVRVLGDSYLELRPERYELVEEVTKGECEVTATLVHDGDHGRKERIVGRGVGFIDALYHGLLEHYAREYPSLKTITFTSFSVRAEMETSREKGADAAGLVELVVTNSSGRAFSFEESHRSIVAASMIVVVEALEYFINSERAFLTVSRALAEARERKRADLVKTYTAQLAELVDVTSYSEVIERIKAEEL